MSHQSDLQKRCSFIRYSNRSRTRFPPDLTSSYHPVPILRFAAKDPPFCSDDVVEAHVPLQARPKR